MRVGSAHVGSRKREVYQPWACLLSIGFARRKPDGDLSNRYPAFRYVPVREDLSSTKKGTRYLLLMPVTGDCQIRRSHIVCINSSSCYFSLVIYAFGTFEAGRKSGGFQIVEICRHGAVVPNNGATINEVRVA